MPTEPVASFCLRKAPRNHNGFEANYKLLDGYVLAGGNDIFIFIYYEMN
jgi:hypothetical protein